MTHLCLNKLKIRNLACIENVDVDIRPFHAFIGPNDSGKSTLLFAMDALFAFAKGESRPQNPWARHWEDGLEVKASVSLGGVGHTYGFSCDSQFDNGLYKEHFDGGFRQTLDNCPDIIGGVAIKAIEAWILAIRGEDQSEKVTNPKERLKEIFEEEGKESCTVSYVEVIDNGSLENLPEDARSLRAWLEKAEKTLG